MNRLGGWWRLWLVLTSALLALVTLGTLEARDIQEVEVRPTGCFPSTLSSRTVSESTLNTLQSYQQTPPEMMREGRWYNPTVQVEYFSCLSWSLMLQNWALALLAAGSLIALVFIARWVITGFKQFSS